MTNRLTALSVKATALALALGFSAQAAANMYRYTDENGQIVISSTIPQEATKRGYDILNDNGRVIDTIPPAPTEEEIAAREAEKQRQKELAEQREQDRALLKRFSHPDQAVKAMHRKIRELEGLIQLKRGNISVISSQLDNEQSRAANMERAGREIPEAMLEKFGDWKPRYATLNGKSPHKPRKSKNCAGPSRPTSSAWKKSRARRGPCRWIIPRQKTDSSLKIPGPKKRPPVLPGGLFVLLTCR